MIILKILYFYWKFALKWLKKVHNISQLYSPSFSTSSHLETSLSINKNRILSMIIRKSANSTWRHCWMSFKELIFCRKENLVMRWINKFKIKCLELKQDRTWQISFISLGFYNLQSFQTKICVLKLCTVFL